MRGWLRRLIARLRGSSIDEDYDERRRNDVWRNADPPFMGGHFPT